MDFKKMSINERFKYIRKNILNKTQLEIADVLDMSHAGVSKIESGKVGLTEKNIKILCREYDLNYAFLVYGEGEIFSKAKEALVDQLADEYKLSDEKKELLQRILALPDEEINIFTKHMFGFDFIKKESDETD